MAEAHPVGFRWVMKAKERGAKIIHVDPRFSRTSAMADVHVPIRAGTRHRLPRRADPPRARDRVLLQGVRPRLHQRRDADQRGLRGHRGPRRPLQRLRPRERRLRPARRGRTRAARSPPRRASASTRRQSFEAKTGAGHDDRRGQDATRRCSTRAASSTSSSATSPATRRRWSSASAASARAVPARSPSSLIANSGRERTTALCYAVGWTQHTAGVQMIRAGAILQLLLGNIGRPGGGILALRGHATIQGSTDIPTLYDLLPGYLHMPHAREGEHDAARPTSTPAAPTRAGGRTSTSTSSAC